MRNKKIFISDIHLGAQEQIQKKYNYTYDWLDKKDADNLYKFLKFLYKKDDLAELIILGDLFDTWVCPVDIIPPTIDEIIKSKKNQKIITMLQKLSKHPEIDVEYVSGNHDMAVTKNHIKKHFPGMIYNNKHIYRAGNIYAEHGHRSTIFNAVDPHGINGYLPIGYFISRLVATQTATVGDHVINYVDHIDDILKIIGINTLTEGVFYSILDEANLDKDTPIIYPRGNSIKVIKAKEVAEIYKHVYDKKQKIYGRKHALLSLLSDLGFQKLIADTIFDTDDINIIVNGHSHSHEFDQDSMFVRDRIFVNSGTWCEKHQPQTYVEIETFYNKNIVSIFKWEYNKPVVIKSGTVFKKYN